MPDLPAETGTFVTELDAAFEAHMDWTRRIVRCAVLRSTPGEDVLDSQAHTLCRFGGRFMANRGHFEMLDAPSAARVDGVHQTMHDAIRSICSDIMAGRPGALRRQAGRPQSLRHRRTLTRQPTRPPDLDGSDRRHHL